MADFKALLNPLIPSDTARKGLSKVNPIFKNFFNSAISFGYGADAALDFLRNEFAGPNFKSKSGNLRPEEESNLAQIHREEQPFRALQSAAKLTGGLGLAGGAINALSGLVGKGKEEEQSNASSPFDVLAQYSPQLAEYVAKELQSNKPLQTIAALLKQNGHPLEGEVKKVEQQVKKNFFDWIHELFGQQSNVQQPQNNASPPTGAQQNTPQASPAREQILQGINQLSQLLQNPRK